MIAKSRPLSLRMLGLNVRRVREAGRLTQEQLAERADLDPTYISGIERGVRNPSVLSLVSLSDGLGVSVAELTATIPSTAIAERPQMALQFGKWLSDGKLHFSPQVIVVESFEEAARKWIELRDEAKVRFLGGPAVQVIDTATGEPLAAVFYDGRVIGLDGKEIPTGVKVGRSLLPTVVPAPTAKRKLKPAKQASSIFHRPLVIAPEVLA